MAIRAGGNISIVYDSLDITQYCMAASVEMVLALIDSTNLASTSDVSTPGTTGYSVPLNGEWSKTLDDKLMPDIITPPATHKTLVIGLGAVGAVVTLTWTTKAFVSNYKPDWSDPKTNAKWSGVLSFSGAPVRT
jgi:hypothetical protein